MAVKSEVYGVYCDGCGAFGDGARYDYLPVHAIKAKLWQRGWLTTARGSSDGKPKDYCYTYAKAKGLKKTLQEYFWWERPAKKATR